MVPELVADSSASTCCVGKLICTFRCSLLNPRCVADPFFSIESHGMVLSAAFGLVDAMESWYSSQKFALITETRQVFF